MTQNEKHSIFWLVAGYLGGDRRNVSNVVSFMRVIRGASIFSSFYLRNLLE
jgi:hypothetical protein